ncbi:MAG: hypothetical protein JNM94_10920 [Phycisphaerae bacterium]|nr:hypothetical protein [Phycisphaerae bacterium]
MPSVRPRTLSSLLAALAAFAGGCLYVAPDPTPRNPSSQASMGTGSQTAVRPKADFERPTDGLLTQEQLSELVQGFADRYYALVSSACDTLSQSATTPEERLLIDRLQSRTISAVYDIASNPDPFSQLLDMTAVVTLTAMLAIDEGHFDNLLGSAERAQILKTPLFKAHQDVWEVAARAMTPEQLETLDALIRDWRKENPEVESVSYVRFDDFASSRGKSTIADVRTGSGLLAPVDEANKAVNEARLFAERAFYMAKRAPLIVSMESDHLMSQFAATPEVRKVVEIGDRIATSADRLSAVAETLPKTLVEERERIVGSVEQTSDSLRATLKDYEAAVARTDELVGSVNRLSDSAQSVMRELDAAAATLTTTIGAAERLAARFEPDLSQGPQKPFDPEVYVRLVADLRGSLVEMNRALAETRAIAEGDAWKKPLAEADRIAKERTVGIGDEMRGLVDVIFSRALILLGALFALLFAHTAFSAWMRRRSASRPAETLKGS